MALLVVFLAAHPAWGEPCADERCFAQDLAAIQTRIRADSDHGLAAFKGVLTEKTRDLGQTLGGWFETNLELSRAEGALLGAVKDGAAYADCVRLAKLPRDSEPRSFRACEDLVFWMSDIPRQLQQRRTDAGEEFEERRHKKAYAFSDFIGRIDDPDRWNLANDAMKKTIASFSSNLTEAWATEKDLLSEAAKACAADYPAAPAACLLEKRAAIYASEYPEVIRGHAREFSGAVEAVLKTIDAYREPAAKSTAWTADL